MLIIDCPIIVLYVVASCIIINCFRRAPDVRSRSFGRDCGRRQTSLQDVGRGDDTVGNPHRAQISQFELFELVLLLKFGKKFPVEQFEATVSQSTVPSPPLRMWARRSLCQLGPLHPLHFPPFPVHLPLVKAAAAAAFSTLEP